MRVLLDTDVLMDVALKREPFFAKGARVIQWAQETPGQAAVAWHSLSNIAYLVRPMHAGSWKTCYDLSRSLPSGRGKQNKRPVFR